jgi:hypothetical protein
MFTRVLFSVVIFLFLYNSIPAQNNLIPTGQLEYEVLTTTLNANLEPQSLRLQINNTGTAAVKSINIYLTGIKGKLTLVYAEKAGSPVSTPASIPLWLIQSQNHSTRDNVLPWNYSDTSDVLTLYPFAYSEPFNLTLEIQVNLSAKTQPAIDQQYSVMVETGLADGEFAASVTGRGNKITFNK